MDVELFEDYREVIIRRKQLLSEDVLQSSVSVDVLESRAFSSVCAELNDESPFNRNWQGLAATLIHPSPDKHTIQKFSTENPAGELLRYWLLESNEGNHSFDMLLERMVDVEAYSAADELLNYMESLNEDKPEDTEKDVTKEVIEHDFSRENEDLSNNHRVNPPPLFRSRSERIVRKFSNWMRFRRSKSCPASTNIIENNLVPAEPVAKLKENEIFIVSSNQDSQTEAMVTLVSLVCSLKPVKKGQWSVNTINSQPRNEMTTTWLTDRVDRSKYVIICNSSSMKRIAEHRNEDGNFCHQSEYNLKFTLDFLITGKLYENLCYNRGGKFLPIVLPGNNFECVFSPLKLFRTYAYPDEKEQIKKYMMDEPERIAPPLGQKMPLVPKELNS